MELGVPSDDKLTEFDETVLRAVYKEINGSLNKSIREHQVFSTLGEKFDPDTSEQNNIIKSIHKLIEKGFLANRMETNYYSTTTMNGMNIYLTLEGREYIQEQEIGGNNGNNDR